jgi:hypothetical protein
MSYRLPAISALCAALVFAAGCSQKSPTPAPSTVAPGQTTANANPPPTVTPAPMQSSLRIWLDGQGAERETARQEAPGTSNWRISRPVSTSPRLKYDITSSGKLGHPTAVNVAIFRQTDGKPAAQADFSVFATDAKAQAQIKPGTDYPLGKPGEKIGVLDAANKPVNGVKLQPGQKYTLILIVKGAAGQGETAQIDFQTK